MFRFIECWDFSLNRRLVGELRCPWLPLPDSPWPLTGIIHTPYAKPVPIILCIRPLIAPWRIVFPPPLSTTLCMMNEWSTMNNRRIRDQRLVNYANKHPPFSVQLVHNVSAWVLRALEIAQLFTPCAPEPNLALGFGPVTYLFTYLPIYLRRIGGLVRGGVFHHYHHQSKWCK